MKRIIFLLLFSIAVSLSACSFAFAQSRTNRITRPCPGSTTPASVTISVLGEIALTPCSGQAVVLPAGTTYGSSFTSGSMLFAGVSGTFAQDNANLFWNDTSNILHIGTTTTRAVTYPSKLQFFSTGSASIVGVTTSDGFAVPAYLGAHSRGTVGAETAAVAFDYVVTFGGSGYDGAAYRRNGDISIKTAEAVTGSAAGGIIDFSPTPIGVLTAGLPYARMRSTSFGLASATQFVWSNASPIPFGSNETIDTGFARYSAGVIRATDGSTAVRGLIGGGSAVASAAALPLPTGRVFHVTGTTSITSITSTNFAAGVCITLIFDGVLTFTDGGNLSIAGNFVTTADDTISLCFDGTNWFETGRSVN